jgi:hypothetical protein
MPRALSTLETISKGVKMVLGASVAAANSILDRVYGKSAQLFRGDADQCKPLSK